MDAKKAIRTERDFCISDLEGPSDTIEILAPVGEARRILEAIMFNRKLPVQTTPKKDRS